MTRLARLPDGSLVPDRRQANPLLIKLAVCMTLPIIGVISTWSVLNYRVSAQEAKIELASKTVAQHDTEIAVVKTDIGYIKQEVSNVRRVQEEQKMVMQEILREVRRP